MAKGFGVTRVVVEFVNGGKKYQMEFDKPEQLQRALYFSLDEAAKASTAIQQNSEKFGTFEDMLKTGMPMKGGGSHKPRLLGEAKGARSISSFICMHDGLCDWFFVADDPKSTEVMYRKIRQTLGGSV